MCLAHSCIGRVGGSRHASRLALADLGRGNNTMTSQSNTCRAAAGTHGECAEPGEASAAGCKASGGRRHGWSLLPPAGRGCPSTGWPPPVHRQAGGQAAKAAVFLSTNSNPGPPVPRRSPHNAATHGRAPLAAPPPHRRLVQRGQDAAERHVARAGPLAATAGQVCEAMQVIH
jgi:hypothetical protein